MTLVQKNWGVFEGSVRGKNITRSKEEAKKFAYEILEKARAGEDFGGLVKKHTDDSYPGIYGMANIGVQKAKGEFQRDRMVPAFGDTGFPLEVDGIVAESQAVIVGNGRALASDPQKLALARQMLEKIEANLRARTYQRVTGDIQGES